MIITTDTPEPRAGRSRSEEREQAILDAALALVVEVGYDRLSMDALAERAHASKATIYRHWSGKAEVVTEALRCRVQDKIVPEDSGSLRDDLLALLRTSCDSFVEEDGALMASVLWAMRSDPVLADLMRFQVLETKHESFEVVFRRAIERGELPEGADPGSALEVIHAVFMAQVLVSGQPLDDAFQHHLVDDVVLPLLRGSLVQP